MPDSCSIALLMSLMPVSQSVCVAAMTHRPALQLGCYSNNVIILLGSLDSSLTVTQGAALQPYYSCIFSVRLDLLDVGIQTACNITGTIYTVLCRLVCLTSTSVGLAYPKCLAWKERKSIKAMLAGHLCMLRIILGSCQLVSIRGLQLAVCSDSTPVSGCWQRFLPVSTYLRRSFVIQHQLYIAVGCCLQPVAT